MQAYQTLEEGRTGGMAGPNPIPVAEIEAYCNLAGIVSQPERLKYLRLIRRLDRAYLDHWAENNKNKVNQ